MTNYNEDDILEAGDHPEDINSALENDFAKKAGDNDYDGQPFGFSRNPAKDELRAEPEQEVEYREQAEARTEEEQEEATGETNYGIDVVR